MSRTKKTTATASANEGTAMKVTTIKGTGDDTMVAFYLMRLAKKSPEERQAYLDETVPTRFRDQVREQWNAEHEDETLD